MKDTQRNFLAAAEKYEDDADPAISSHANFSLAMLPLADFLITRDPKHLELIKVQFDLRSKKIFQNFYAARQFGKSVVKLKDVKGFESTNLTKTVPEVRLKLSKSIQSGGVSYRFQRH